MVAGIIRTARWRQRSALRTLPINPISWKGGAQATTVDRVVWPKAAQTISGLARDWRGSVSLHAATSFRRRGYEPRDFVRLTRNLNGAKFVSAKAL
jgi:hypothetical protein